MRKKSFGLNVLLIFLIGCLCFCGYKLYDSFEEYWQDYLKQESVLESANKTKKINFKKLQKKCPDLVGWIYCKGTRIDYPVVQSQDNKEYLSLGPDKKWSGAGSIFCDYRTKEPFRDPLTIAYGHHMRDGSMFHCLEDFKKSEYLKKHDTIYFYTPTGGYKAKIVYTSIIPALDDAYVADIQTKEDKEALLNKVGETAVARTSESIDADSNYVMLSTCSYEYNEARAVVIGKLEELSPDEYANSNRERIKEHKSKWEVFWMMIWDLLKEAAKDARECF